MKKTAEELQKIIDEAYEESDPYKKAVLFQVAWLYAEEGDVTSFQQNMELCNLTEHYSKKAIGEDVGDYKSVPRITLSFKPNRK